MADDVVRPDRERLYRAAMTYRNGNMFARCNNSPSLQQPNPANIQLRGMQAGYINSRLASIQLLRRIK